MNHSARPAEHPAQQPSNAPASDTQSDTEQYQAAKGCLLLSLFTIASGVICALVGYGIHAYIEATTGG